MFCVYITSDAISLFSNPTVIAVPQEVTVSTVSHSSYNSDDSYEPGYDYSERRTLPISVPDYEAINTPQEKYVASYSLSLMAIA